MTSEPAPPRDPGRATPFATTARRRRKPLLWVALVAVATQSASATWVVRDFSTPNDAGVIAYNLARTGRYEGGSWLRLTGRLRPEDPLRAYQLPGQPLYLAAGLRLLPERATRYLAVPVTAVLVVAAAYVAGLLGGARAAIAAGTLGALLPFTIVHGPVWDDAFLGAACAWLMLALVARRLSSVPTGETTRARVLGAAGIAVAVTVGTLARAEEQAIALGFALLLVLAPRYRTARLEGLTILVALALSLAAWGARNARVLGRPFFGSSHDGIALWEANGPYTDSAVTLGQVEALSHDATVVGPLWARTADLSELDADAVFRRAGLAYLASHPVAAARVMVRKAALSLAGVRPQLPLDAPRNFVALVTNAALLAASAVGLARLRRRRGDPLVRDSLPLLAILAAVVFALLLVGPIGMRYWITLQGALWLLAAQAVTDGRSLASAISTSTRLPRRTHASTSPAAG